MPEYKLLIFIDPLPGRETECNHWYDNQDVPECLSMPAFTSAQRLRMGPQCLEGGAPTRYAVIYDLEAAILADALSAHEKFDVPDHPDLANAHAWPLTPLGPVVDSDSNSAPATTHRLACCVDPKPGREDEFDAWYDGEHVLDCLTMPTLVRAQRFVTNPQIISGGAPPTRHACIYDHHASTLDDVLKDAMDAHVEFGVPSHEELSGAKTCPLEPLGPIVYTP